MSKQTKVPIVKITFHGLPDFIYSVQQWENDGGYKGFLKTGACSISQIKKVIYGCFMPFNKFHSLAAWEG